MYKESSSSQSSTPRKTTMTLVEKVEVHQFDNLPPPKSHFLTEKNESIKSDNLLLKNPPVPLPRKKIFIANSSNESSINNNDIVISNKGKDSTEKVSKQSKEEQNKNRKLREIPILKSNDSLLTSSSKAESGAPMSPQPSKRRNFYFAESRNDTIVTNESKNSIFSIDEEEVTSSSQSSSPSSKCNLKIPFISSNIEYIDEKQIDKKLTIIKSRRAVSTTSQSQIDSESSQCVNPKTSIPVAITRSEIKVKSTIPKTLVSPPSSLPQSQMTKQKDSKTNRRKSKSKTPVILSSSSSSSDNHETDTVVSSSSSSSETELESNELTSKPMALLSTKKTHMKKIPIKSDRRKSKNENLYRRKSGVSEGGVSERNYHHNVVDGKNKYRDKRDRRASSRIMDYSYDKIVGILLHQTSELRSDSRMTGVHLRISFCDMQTKNYLKKSSKSRNVVNYGEPEILDYIQPVISKAGRFMNSRCV